MATFLSSRVKNLKVGIPGYTDGTEVAGFIGNVDIDGEINVNAFNDGSSTGLVNYVIAADGSGGWSWQSIASVGAVTSPGGTDGQVQYNNAGSMAGASVFYYDDVNNRVGIGTSAPGYDFEVDGDVSLLGVLRDKDGDAGTFGQVLMSTATGVDWVDAAPADAITGLNIYEEGTLQGSANAVSSLDFVGSYITATVVGSTATITMNESPNFTGLTVNSNTVWHEGNDGTGSGLDADLLDGQQGTYYLDYTNLNNRPTIGNAVITIAAGVGMTGGGDFTTNQTIAETITITHADTSTQASVNNSNGVVIQDITLDGFGHITALGSIDLDGRYYTETEADARFLGINAKAADSDLLDGQDSTYYLNTSATTQTKSGGLNVSGDFGVGTTSPSTKFHVVGDSTFTSNVSIGSIIDIIPYDTLNNGTLSFEGSAGQLFSITNNLTSGSIFSVNDVSGLPSIDVDANGTIVLAEFGGNVGIGTATPGDKLDVVGSIRASSQLVSLVATGTSPLLVSSSTVVNNLNADLLDGQHGSYYLNTSTQFGGDVSGTYNAIVVANDSHTHDTRYYTETESDARFLGINAKAADSDLLDGQDGSYYLNTSTQFGGDVSGTYNAIVVANDSHTHDGRYYTEAEADARFLGINAKAADSNLLDGIDSGSFLRSDANDSASGVIDFLGGSSTTPAIRIKSGGNNWSEGLAIHPSSDNGYALTFYRPSATLTTNTNTWAIGNLGANGTNNFGLLKNGLTGGSGIRVDSIFDVTQSGTFRFGFNPTVGSNVIWHAGNDGSGSGLDADLLDGQQGSYYLNTSTQFGGDVSGTYNAIVVANDSHTHDGRYYTEAEADARFLGINAKAADTELFDGIDSGSFLRSDVDDTFDGNLTLTGELRGPATFIIDPAAVGDNTGKVVIRGDFQVDGTTTTINSTTLTVDDKAIVVASGAGTAAAADGAGISVDGADATITYSSSGDSWVFNKAPYYNTSRLLTTADEGAGNGLDADTLDGQQGSYYLNASNINAGVIGDAYLPATISSDITGNAATATKLATARSISLTGDVTGSVSFDGSANVSITAAVVNDSHTHDGRYYTEAEADARFLGISAKAADSNLLDGIDSGSFLRSDQDDTTTGNLTISKTSPKLILNDTNATTGSYPGVQFDTNNNQGVLLEHNEFDSELPTAGYGLVLKGSPNNGEFPTTGTLSLCVLGEIYTSGTTLGSISRVLTTADEGAGNGLDADTLDGQQGTYYLDYNNFSNIPTIGNGTLTVSTGGGLTGSGTFTANQTTNTTITVSHADTSSVANLTASSRTYVTALTFDTYGHVTGYSTGTETVVDTNTTYGISAETITGGANLRLTGSDASTDDVKFAQGANISISRTDANTITISGTNTTYSAGAGLDLNGTVFSHTDTSSQASVDNANGTVIQDITLDTFGHITAIGSVDLDTRYLGISAKAADSNLLDGIDSGSFLRSDVADTFSSKLTFTQAGSAEFIQFPSSTTLSTVAANDKVIVFRNLDQLRFENGNNWNYNSWAGIRFDSTNNAMYIGGPAASQFTSNAAPPSIDIDFVGLNASGLKKDGNTIWHAGNDGSGSGLDADTLDGQQGSYYLNTSTTFGGDVSGTYNAIVVANDSHTHDTRYYTEAEADGRFLGINDKASDSHLLDGIDSGSFLRSDANDSFSGNLTNSGNNYITFGPNSTWGAYLRIGGNGYQGASGIASIATTDGNLHLDAAPGGYATYLNHYAGTGGVGFGNGASANVAWMGPDGDLWKGSSDNTGSKYWHAGNDGSGSGLDADLLDGQQGSYYLDTSATTQTKSGGLNVSGNVGIGTINPRNVLDLGSSSTNRGISWGGTTGNYANIWTEYGTANLHIAQGIRPEGTNTGWVSSYGGGAYGRSLIKMNFTSGNLSFHTATASTVADGSAVTVDPRLTITGGGNVGIGTTNPTGKLDVRGNLNVLNSNPGGSVSVTITNQTTDTAGTKSIIFLPVFNGTTGGVIEEIGNSADGYRLNIYQGQNSGVLTFGTGGNNERLRITSTGNVGIGTTNPSEKLEVNGNLLVGSPIYANTSSPVIRLGHQAGDLADGTIRGTIQFDSIQDYSVNTGDSWRWKIATVARPGTGGNYNSQFEILRSTRAGVTDNTDFCIARNGNVGIGMTNPDTKLDVNGTIRGERYVGRSTLVLNSYATVNPSSNVFLYSQPNDRDSWIYLDSADTGSNWGIYHRQIDSDLTELPRNSIGFVGGGNSALKAYISLQSGDGYFSGNVGIGTHAPQHKFHIYGPSNDGAELLTIEATSVSSTTYTWGSTLIAPQNVGQALINLVGQGLSQKNSGYFGFVYEGAGSNSNYVTIGGYASDRLLNIKMDGNVGIGTTNPGEKLSVFGSDNHISANESGTTSTWRARILSKNSSANVASFLGVYATSPGVFAHNHALNAWNTLYVNTTNGSGDGGNVLIAGAGNVGIGTANPGYKLEVNGSFAATTKSFIIPHPTKEGYKLRYGSLEGPENGVYVRGRSKEFIIELPEYWTKLVDPDSITVSLTPIGHSGIPRVEKIEDNKVYVFTKDPEPLNYFYTIFAERIDVEKLEVEFPIG